MVVQRSSHQFRLAACDTRLMAVMPRLEAVGDAVWFQGELYRQKMHGDVQAMLSRVTEQVHARRQMEDELRKSPETKRAVIQKEQVVAAKTEMRIAPRGLPAGQWGRTAPMTPVYLDSSSPRRPATSSGVSRGARPRPS